MIKTKDEFSKEIKWVAARIKQLRKEQGNTSQASFARAKGFTLSYYSRLERGEHITVLCLIKVCTALEISFEEFFSGFEEAKPVKKKK